MADYASSTICFDVCCSYKFIDNFRSNPANGGTSTHQWTTFTRLFTARYHAVEPSFPSATILLLFWHAPLRVRSAIHKHQHPQRMVLSQVDCFIQCEVVGCQISLDGVQPCDMGMPWWSLPALWWGAIRIILASASSSIRAMCPNIERRSDWIIVQG